MSREYAQLQHALWNDADFRARTVPAQHLFMLILSDPKLTYCGVTTWHPGRIAVRSAENTARDTILAALELCEHRFLVIDEETEEVMIRSYVRRDPFIKNPRLAVSMTKDFGTIASNKIRSVLVHELKRLKREQPDLDAWKKDQVVGLLRQPAVSAEEITTDLPVAAATHFGVGLEVGLPSAIGKREVVV